MKIRPITNRLKSSSVFKTVRFSRDMPDLTKFKPDELPAVYMLPASSRGGAESGDLHTQQESLSVYSFCVITAAPTPNGTDEPLDEALSELRSLLFGFQIAPDFAPLVMGTGDLFDFNSRVNAWVETFVARKTYKT